MKKISAVFIALLVIVGGYFAVTTTNFGFGQGYLGQDLREVSGSNIDQGRGVGYRVYYFGPDGNRFGSDVFVERDNGDVNFTLPKDTYKVEVQSNFVNSDDLATFSKEESHMSIDFGGFLKKACVQEGEFNTVGKIVAICEVNEKDFEISLTAKWGDLKLENNLIFKVTE